MDTKKYSKMAWLWENMKGYRFIYMLAIIGTLTYNAMQLSVPYITQNLVDLFLSGENAAQNFVNEILEEQALIKEITGGYVSELCRAPYGTGGGTFTDAHVEELKKAGIKCWDWDVDSLDWESNATVDSIMKNIEYCMNLWNYPTHTVVLFHEKDITVEVLPKVIQYYQDLGYEFLPYNPDSHIVKNLFGSDDI